MLRAWGGRSIAVALACFIAVALQVPAAAGGSWLELEGGDRVLVPGETVTMSGTFGAGQQADISAGPWNGRLVPDGSKGPTVPLGAVTVSEGGSWGWRAAVTFAVPQVPTGEYWVQVVNDHGEGIGDLIGGSVKIAPSPEAWRVLVLEDRLRRQEEAAREMRASLRGRLQDAQIRLADVTASRDELEDRVAELEAEVASARAVASSAREGAQPIVPWPAAVLVAISVLALVVALARRRVPAPPGSAPAADPLDRAPQPHPPDGEVATAPAGAVARTSPRMDQGARRASDRSSASR